MADPILELQAAVRTALLADATLATLMGGTVRFYDYVPEDSAQPYIVYRSGNVAAWDTDETDAKTGFGHEHMFTFNIWSSYEGTQEALNILRRIYDLMQNDAGTLSLATHTLVNLRFMFQDIVPEPDGQSYHAVAQYRAITEEN